MGNPTCFFCHYNFDGKCSLYSNLDIDEAVSSCEDGPVTGFEYDQEDIDESDNC